MKHFFSLSIGKKNHYAIFYNSSSYLQWKINAYTSYRSIIEYKIHIFRLYKYLNISMIDTISNNYKTINQFYYGNLFFFVISNA